MKRIVFVAFLATGLACQPKQEQSQTIAAAEASSAAEWQQYGAEISAEGAVNAAELPGMAAKEDTVFVKVKAAALSSCPMKGCWMKVRLNEDEEMRVRFKDYAFFVPKDLKGEEVVFEGILTQQVNDVETLRHYAQDAGASEEEINRITEPKKEYSFEATGVLVKR